MDIGCGSGRDAKYPAEKGFDVTGIDAAEAFVRLASKNVLVAKFVQMDMRNLQFPDSSFDGIWACASFLHIPKKEAKSTLLGFKRILRKGGLLFMTLKQGTGEKFVEKEEYQGRRKFFSFYLREECQNLLESCGFRIEELTIEKKKNIWINIFAIKKACAGDFRTRVPMPARLRPT